MLEVHHFGPDTRYVGGMATVIDTYCRRSVGADVVVPHATWVPTSQLQSARLFACALRTVFSLPRNAIVHVHLSEGGSFLREGAVLIAARRRGLKTAATLHGALFADFARRRPIVVGSVLRHAQLVTALSDEMLTIVGDIAAGSRRVLLPNPIELDEEATSAARAEPTVLFAGELSTRKGVDVLLNAWPLVFDVIPGARCVLVGPPADVAVRAAVPGLDVLAPRPPAEIRPLLRAARVAVLPSRAEAMPMFLLEAMAAARPFVSTPVGGVPALAASGGRLVPVDDVEALAQALTDLLGNPELAARLGFQGQAACRATHSTAAVGTRLRRLYEEIGTSA
jgi:glycosyltransferase involved in cell wall biosynthesis